ncbi:MAG: Gfo/Idh/MocA family oxidoreductase [Paracoccaceae bacterium]
MISVAIIGAGIGAQHLAGYRALPARFKVAALCDLDLERAAQATGNAPDIRLTDDLASVLADDTIELIDICLPPHLHFPTIMQALEAGKHVVCEKPVTRALAELDKVEAAAKASGKQVFPVFQYRYGPALDQLAALQKAGLCGKAYTASIETHWNRDSAYYSVPWRGTWAGEAGGALLGHAIHAHDILCHVLGPVAEVFAFTDTRVNPIETEDCAAVAFRMQSGALVTSSVTLGAGNDTTRLRFCFEGLTAQSGSAPYTPAEAAWRFIARNPAMQPQIDAVVAAVPAGPVGFTGYLDAIATALSGRGDSHVSLGAGRRSIELVSAIYSAARNNAPVQLPLGKGAEFYETWLPSQEMQTKTGP